MKGGRKEGRANNVSRYWWLGGEVKSALEGVEENRNKKKGARWTDYMT